MNYILKIACEVYYDSIYYDFFFVSTPTRSSSIRHSLGCYYCKQILHEGFGVTVVKEYFMKFLEYLYRGF